MPSLPRARTVSLPLLAALLFAPVALAQSAGAQRYLDAASLLYEQLEYERALDQLKKARAVSGGVDDDVNIAMYEGIILFDLGKKDEAVAAFREGLYLKPEGTLPVKVAPKIAEVFTLTQRAVLKELAPILAKRKADEEKRRLEAEQARKLADTEQARKVAETEAERKRLEAEKADLAVRVAMADAERKRFEAEKKRQAEEEAKRAEAVRLAAQSDRPERTALVITETKPTPDYVPPKKAEPRGVPVAPIVLGGLAVAAGAVGGVFGYLSTTDVTAARAASFQSETVAHLDQASTNALVANVAFAAAGTAGIAALISLLVGRDPPPPPPETP